MAKESIFEKLKEYGGIGFIILSGLVASAISYGSSQATASITFTDHEKRLSSVEQDDKEYGKAIARMDQKINDIWHDLGHRE